MLTAQCILLCRYAYSVGEVDARANGRSSDSVIRASLSTEVEMLLQVSGRLAITKSAGMLAILLVLPLGLDWVPDNWALPIPLASPKNVSLALFVLIHLLGSAKFLKMVQWAYLLL